MIHWTMLAKRILVLCIITNTAIPTDTDKKISNDDSNLNVITL